MTKLPMFAALPLHENGTTRKGSYLESK